MPKPDLSAKRNPWKDISGMLFVLLPVAVAAGLVVGYDAPRSAPSPGKYANRAFANCSVASEGIDRSFCDSVATYLEKRWNAAAIDSGAVYFKDFSGNRWFSVNAAALFLPASLLKVPLAMAAMKLAEEDPTFLDSQIQFASEFKLPPGYAQTIRPHRELVVGKSYTVKELIAAALQYSDNQAAVLLRTKVGAEPNADVFRSLGLSTDFLTSAASKISVTQYTTFFTSLFDSSYLPPALSEKILDTLKNADFSDGITAGIPSDVTVAHKFGESGTDLGHRQLHDCGIVYYPNYPYLLCIMTQGRSLPDLESTIQGISRIVYGEVDKRYQPGN